MGDLYNSKTYTFDDLCKKHGDFAVPSYKINVCGKDLSEKLGYYVDNISVCQTIRAESGSCRFSVVNAYDIKSQGFKSDFEGAFPLGGEVDVSLGYKTTEMVFKGFIGDVSFSFSEGSTPSATITCYDARMLMMQGRRRVTLVNAPFKTVIDKLFEYYTPFMSLKNDCADSFNDQESFNQYANDFEYVYSYARSHGYDFFVLGDKAYIQKRKAETQPIMTLRWGESLLSYSCNYTYNGITLKGALTAPPERKPVEEGKDTKSKYKQKLVTNKPIIVHTSTSKAKNTEDLKRIIKSRTEKREEDATGSSATCIGIPELIPGRFIKLEKLDGKILDGAFYISAVNHEYSSRGYTVSLDLSEKPAMAGELAIQFAKNPSDVTVSSVEKLASPIIGTVIKNYDEEHPCCVQVEIPDFPEEMRVVGWARVAVPFAGEKHGFYHMPEIGDEVLVAFRNGEIDNPIVIGALFNEKSTLPAKEKNEENNLKSITTKSGHIITFNDEKEKTYIDVMTAGKMALRLDDEKKTIIVRDSKSENLIELKEEDGVIAITAKNKITLTAGETMLCLDGEGKKMETKSDNISLNSSQAIKLEGNQMSFEGKQADIKADTIEIAGNKALNLKSSQSVVIKGGTVKLN